MTVFTSTAKSFGMLLVARIGVGIGEAGCSPPIHSLIADLYPERKRATALSIYSLGIPIGGALGTLIGGWVGEYFGWRMAFLVVGFPGILLALIFFLTIKEPPRGYSEPGGIPARKKEVPLKQTLQFMWKLNSFRHMAFAGSLHAFVGYGVALFLPSFFTGSLITRFGVLRIMGVGILMLFASVAASLNGDSVAHFVAALVLLGLGWNFLFIDGTTLVTESYTPSEKAKTQGLNDLMIFGTVALTAGISGVVHEVAGWQMLNLLVLPFLLLALLLIIWFSRVRQSEGAI